MSFPAPELLSDDFGQGVRFLRVLREETRAGSDQNMFSNHKNIGSTEIEI